MTRYFFDISGTTGRFHRDYVGEELYDDRAAWREALSQVRTVEDSLAPGGTLHLHVREGCREVFELRVSSHWIEPPTVASLSIAARDEDTEPSMADLIAETVE